MNSFAACLSDLNCRGHYDGDEEDRLDILKQAATLGASHIDVELLAAPEFLGRNPTLAQITLQNQDRRLHICSCTCNTSQLHFLQPPCYTLACMMMFIIFHCLSRLHSAVKHTCVYVSVCITNTNTNACLLVHLDLSSIPAVSQDHAADFKMPKGCKMIVSSHNFEETPKEEELQNMLQMMEEIDPDVVKIATTARDITDCARMLRLIRRAKGLHQ